MADDVPGGVEISKETGDEQLKRWKGRIMMAQRHLEDKGNTGGRWDDNVKALAGDFNSAEELGEESIDVNMVRSTAKTTLPPLYILDPHIAVRATKSRATVSGTEFDNVRAAEHTELEINYWLRELKVRHQIRKMVIDGETTNQGYIYMGWTDAKRDSVDNHPTVKAGQPFIRRHSPKMVLVPNGYTDLEDCPWVDIVFHKTMAEVNRMWPDTKNMDIEATIELDTIRGGEGKEFREFLDSDDAKLIEVHVCWNKEDKKVYTFTLDADEYLEKPKRWPWDLEGFPLVHYRPEEIPDEYWGTPPISYGLPQNKERNATRTAMRIRMNRTKNVIFAAADVADEVAEQYAAADDGTVIPIPLQEGERLGDKIQIDTGLPFDTGSIMYDRVISDDYRVTQGASSEQLGGGDPNVDSATASANIEKNVQIRNSERGDRVRDVYLSIARKLIMLLRRNPNQERTRRIAGNEAGQFTEVNYTLRDLHGEFDLELDFSAMLSDNPLTRVQQSLTNYNLLRADPQVEAEKLLFDVFQAQNKPNPASYLVALRQPDEELAMMGMALPVEAHERDPHQQHIAAHDQQLQEIEQALNMQAQRDPQFEESPEGMKLRTTVTLLVAHLQDHVRKMEALVGPGAASPFAAGRPLAENQFRNAQRTGPGRETQAEMTGQPLQPTDGLQ